MEAWTSVEAVELGLKWKNSRNILETEMEELGDAVDEGNEKEASDIISTLSLSCLLCVWSSNCTPSQTPHTPRSRVLPKTS